MIVLPLCNLFPQVLTEPPCLLAAGLINNLFIPYPRSLTKLFNKTKPDIWPSNTWLGSHLFYQPAAFSWQQTASARHLAAVSPVSAGQAQFFVFITTL